MISSLITDGLKQAALAAGAFAGVLLAVGLLGTQVLYPNNPEAASSYTVLFEGAAILAALAGVGLLAWWRFSRRRN